MKKNEPQNLTLLASLVKAVTTALSSLFFSDDNREFERLKNFITS